MITYYFRSKKEDAITKTESLRPGTWVHAENPTEVELDTLAQQCVLDRDLLTDAMDLHEVPRIERENEVTYFFARFPHEGPSELETAPILFTITPTAVVSISKVPTNFLHPYIEGKKPLFTTQRAKLFLQLMDAVNTAYRRKLITIRREIQRSRIQLNRIHNKDIVRLVNLEQTLNDFVNSLTPTHVALNNLLRSGHLELYEDDKDLIEDLQLENQQLVESAKANLKTIQNVRSSYTAIVTNNLNSVIKLLTSLTIILTIPTILGSLFGMNVLVPFAHTPHAFYVIAVVAVVGMAIAGYIFRKKDWM